MDENVCYLILYNASTTNNQQIFRVSLHCSPLLIFHPSSETFPLFIPRLIDPCLFPPHLTTAEWNHSVNVYCFVFINKNATTESSTSFDKGWKIIMFNVHTIPFWKLTQVLITSHANVDWDRWKWMTIERRVKMPLLDLNTGNRKSSCFPRLVKSH